MQNGTGGSNEKMTTERMIHALTAANTSDVNALHQHVFREALRALVRVAKAEKLLEIKRDVALSIGLDRRRLPLPPRPET
jgi:hypothetical protein